MFLSKGQYAPMPIHMPTADDMRQRIAAIAATLANRDVAHFLDLLGPIEIAGLPISENEAAWRLTSYHGSHSDNDAIERAVAQVQRSHPFIDPR